MAKIPQISEIQNLPIRNEYLQARDEETLNASELIFTITKETDKGILFIDTDNSRGYLEGIDTKLVIGSTFTQQDIYNGQIMYKQESALGDAELGHEDEDNNDSFKFELRDGHGQKTEIGEETFNIQIEGYDSYPILESNTGAELEEDAVVIIDNTMLKISDPDFEEDEQTPTTLVYTLEEAPSSSFGFLFLDAVDPDTKKGNGILE